MLDTGKISCEPYYNLPMVISPIDSINFIPNHYMRWKPI